MFEWIKLFFHFGHHRQIPLNTGKLEEILRAGDLFAHFFELGDGLFQLRLFLQNGLGVLLVVPEIGNRGLRLELRYLLKLAVKIKGTP